MKKVSKSTHEIGYRAIGGFAGHEHTHPTGEQVCLNCGKSLEEIIKKRIINCKGLTQKTFNKLAKSI